MFSPYFPPLSLVPLAHSTRLPTTFLLPEQVLQAVVREGEVTVDGATAWLVLKEGCLQCFEAKDKAEAQWQVSLGKEAAAVRAVELRGEEALAVVLAEAVEVEEEQDGGWTFWLWTFWFWFWTFVLRKQVVTTTPKKKVILQYLSAQSTRAL